MIGLRSVNLVFGNQVVFNDINLTLNAKDRFGLVGLNGSGKSTLLKVIAEQQPVNSGVVERSSRCRIGYLPQEMTFASSKNVIDEAVGSVTELEQEDAALVSVKAHQILDGLGFNQMQLISPVASLSAGWKMRLVLAQLLLQEADFYLFDEPTNHLDLPTKEWFFDFLQSSRCGFLLVSHDRYFLDRLCSQIIELEYGTLTIYRGNYTSYIEQKEARRIVLEASYNRQQRDISRKQATIERFRASASKSRMAKSMEKSLEKIERIKLPPSPKKMTFPYLNVPSSGRIVLTVERVGYRYDNRAVLADVSFIIERSERVALVAANGTGKTTLLSIIAGLLPEYAGRVQLGHNVTLAFCQQDQSRVLDPEKTIFESVCSSAPRIPTSTVQALLGCFLFGQELMLKKISVLSGGEKNRVGMAQVLLQQANLLLLDEPTNHLDIPSKERLLDALKAYGATLLFVSHDHDFVSRLATRVIELTPTAVHSYPGTYEEYLDRKKHAQEAVSVGSITMQQQVRLQTRASQPGDFHTRKELKRLEQKIERTERELADYVQKLGALRYGEPEFVKISERVKHLEQQRNQALVLWEKLFVDVTDS